MQGSATNYTYGNRKGKRAQIDLPSRITPPRSCVVPTQHSMSGKGVTNLRTINLLAYIILNNYLENISLQKKKIIYTHRRGNYNVLYIYSESHLLVLLHLYCLQNLTFTFTKSSQTYMWWNPTVVLALLYTKYHGRLLRYLHG